MSQRIVRAGVVLATVVALSLVGIGAPALAESSSCIIAVYPFGTDGCTTGSVAANRAQHFVYVKVSPKLHWEVYDITNNIVVSSGSSGILGKNKTIFGLYSRYKLEVHGVVGRGVINNT